MAKINPEKQYRATEPLFVGRARAANAGDVVDGSTVVNQPDWHDKVELVEDTNDALDINQSAAKVLGWVGDDSDRAKLALLAEQDKGERARAGLVSDLEAIAGTVGESQA